MKQPLKFNQLGLPRLDHRYVLYRKRVRRSLGLRPWHVAVVLVLVGLAVAAGYHYSHHAGKGTGTAIPAVKHSPIPVPSQSSGQASVLGDKAYGIAAGSSLPSLDGAALDARMQGIAALNVTWIRLDFDWSIIQPDNSRSYDWTKYDRIVAASKKYNLNVLGIITYTPAWARPSTCKDSTQCAPANAQQFATFAAAVAERYKGQGLHTWEVWNEPNSKDFWQPKADAAAYTDLLKKAHEALKKQDSEAYIITGGLSPHNTDDSSYAPVDFLNAIYANGGSNSFEAVADHPYTFPLSPTSKEDHAWNQMASPVTSIRQTMVNNGDETKKVWITEFGAPTGGPGPVSTSANPKLDEHPYVVDEALQAKILSDAIDVYRSYTWAGPFFVYSYKDAGTSQSTNENFFGLIKNDGTHKIAYDVYFTAASAIR